MKQKNLYQEAQDQLFKAATPAVKKLRQQATKEARQKARAEWKATNEALRRIADQYSPASGSPKPGSPVRPIGTYLNFPFQPNE